MNGIPGEKMRFRQLVSAFIEVAFRLKMVQRKTFVLEEKRCGNHQCQGPDFRYRLFLQLSFTQGRPAVYGIHDVNRCLYACLTASATCYQKGSTAVAFHIIISAVSLGLEEELAAGVFPWAAVIAGGHGPYGLFPYPVFQKDAPAIMRDAKGYFWLIRIVSRPIVAADEVPFYSIMV